MTIEIQLPNDLAEGLARLAKQSGLSEEQIALSAIRHRVSPFADIDRLMAPTYAAMKSAGIDEDDAVEIFEAEKHALRRERQAESQ
jgi:hypothetical protein